MRNHRGMSGRRVLARGARPAALALQRRLPILLPLLLVALPSPALIAQTTSTRRGQIARPMRPRSVLDWRERLPDRLRGPRMRNRVTHRGWEVRERQFTIVATTSEEDAAEAARAFQKGWQRAADEADQWSSQHRRPRFGTASTVVLLNGDSLPGDKVRLEAVRDQYLVSIPIGPRGLPAEQRAQTLQEAAVHALFRVAEWDRTLPQDIRVGLARMLSETDPPTSGRAPPLAPDAWQAARVTPDQYETKPQPTAEIQQWVPFLMFGDAGKHAWRLAEAITDHRTDPNVWDRLHADLDADFQKWLSRGASRRTLPLRSAPYAAPDLQAAQADLYVLLQLAARWKPTRPAPPPVAVSTGPPARRPGGAAAAGQGGPEGAAEGAQAAAESAATKPARIFDTHRFAARFLAGTRQPWSVRDASGKLVTQRDAWPLVRRAQFGVRTWIALRDGRPVVSYHWSGQWLLEGSLEIDKKAPKAGPQAIRFRLVSLIPPKGEHPEDVATPDRAGGQAAKKQAGPSALKKRPATRNGPANRKKTAEARAEPGSQPSRSPLEKSFFGESARKSVGRRR